MSIPDVPRRLWPSFKKSKFWPIFKIHAYDWRKKVVKSQLHGRTPKPKIMSPYMDWLFWARIWGPILERWPSLTLRPELFLSLSGEKAKGSVGWSVANVSKGSCPRSPINCPRHFQTSKGTNRNNFYVNPDPPRRPQTPLTKFEKIQILTDFKIHAYAWRKKVVKNKVSLNTLRLKRSDTIWM